MGIYGAAHTDLESMDYYTLSIPCMGNQLKERYGESVFSKELSSVGDVEPERVDTIELAGKEYQASYFGIKDSMKLLVKFQPKQTSLINAIVYSSKHLKDDQSDPKIQRLFR